MRIVDWKEEAQLNAAIAGELKILITERLKEMKSRRDKLQKEVIDSNDYNHMYCVLNRLSFIKEEIEWLEGALDGERKRYDA